MTADNTPEKTEPSSNDDLGLDLTSIVACSEVMNELDFNAVQQALKKLAPDVPNPSH